MIKVIFITSQRRIVFFEVDGRIIRYFDEVWKKGIQIMPKDQNILRKLIRSRKTNLRMMAALIFDANKGKNLEEYNSCKDEKALAEFVRQDCKSKGLMEI